MNNDIIYAPGLGAKVVLLDGEGNPSLKGRIVGSGVVVDHVDGPQYMRHQWLVRLNEGFYSRSMDTFVSIIAADPSNLRLDNS